MGDMEGGGMQWRSAIHSDDGVFLHPFITLSSTPPLLTSTNLYPRHPVLSLPYHHTASEKEKEMK